MSKKKGQVIITQFENPGSIVTDEGQVEYPQIQIVNASGIGTRAKTKNKLIYIGEGELTVGNIVCEMFILCF